VLRVVFSLNVVFHPLMFVIVWRNLLPLRMVNISCLLFASGICAACMALRLYSPTDGASIGLQPLYLWIPVIYVFAFTLSGHKSSLTGSHPGGRLLSILGSAESEAKWSFSPSECCH
jgi:diguanylate cyclase